MRSTLALALLLPTVACVNRKSDTQDTSVPDSATETGDTVETGHTGDTTETGHTDETGNPPVFELGCNSDWQTPATDLPAPTAVKDGSMVYRVVEIPDAGFEHLYVTVFYPADPTLMAYDEGAPVIVLLVPNTTTQTGALEPRVSAGMGVIEVQPIFPSWQQGGFTTSGTFDAGGDLSAAATRGALLFATGQVATVDGTTLGQVVERDVCNSHTVLMGTSRGDATALRTLELFHDDLAPTVVGFGAHEAPSVPQFIVGDGGWIWMDPDEDVDADGSGFGWDDARNRTYVTGACGPLASRCELDYSRLQRTLDYTIDQFSGQYKAMPGETGVFWLDNDGDGQLTALGAPGAYSQDRDGNGAIDDDEDFLLWPLQDPVAPTLINVQVYSRELLAEAVALGLVDPGAWPSGLAPVSAVEAFWAGRNPMSSIANLTKDWTAEELTVSIEYTTKDHANGNAARPHVWQMYEGFRQAGLNARYNLSADAAACVMSPDDLVGWGGEVPYGADLAEEDLPPYGLPVLKNTTARPVAAIGLLWDLFGPFDHCTY